MNRTIDLKAVVLILFTAVLGFVICLVIYLQYFKPIKEQVTFLENELQFEREVLHILEKKENLLDDMELDESNQLRDIIPPQRALEPFLLQLQKIETLSQVHIKQMSFQEQNVPQVSTGSIENETSENITDIPENLNKITTQMVVEAHTYTQLKQFVEQLENMTRLTTIDKLQFQLPLSEGMLQSPFIVNIDISIYFIPTYDPDVQQLENLPSPANKPHPFPA